MIMPMILGIAVDDTIHFTNHIKYHWEVWEQTLPIRIWANEALMIMNTNFWAWKKLSN